MNDNTTTPANPSRRRLAKGGLAAPVVLASLTSKNAFAALPYHCFVSGKLSNNMSPFGPNAQSANQSCSLPQSSGTVQSSLTNDARTFSSIFGINVYVTGNGNNQTLTLSSSTAGNGNGAPKANPLATLNQVLSLPNGSNPVSNLSTLKQGVVIYENARKYPPPNDLVPLSTQQVVNFIQAVNSRSSVTVTAAGITKTFSQQDIINYFSELTVA